MPAANGQGRRASIRGASEIREYERACIGSKATVHMYGPNPPFGLYQKGETLGAGSMGDPLCETNDQRMY